MQEKERGKIMKKLENKKNIIIGCLIGGLVVLAGVIFAITSNKESKTNETLQTAGDIKKMLETIYKNLADELPELTTEEINLKESELVESLTGLKRTDDINTLVVSEPVMGSQALEVAVIKTKENNVRSANSITIRISTTKTTTGIDSIVIPKNSESESFNLEVKTPAPDINKA